MYEYGLLDDGVAVLPGAVDGGVYDLCAAG